MPDTDLTKRAAEIDEAVKQADAKRRSDADAAGVISDEIMKVLRGLGDSITAIGQRMDTMEAAKESQSEPAAKSDVVEADGTDEPTGRARDAAVSVAQARADAVCAARGERAPPPMAGERLSAYRRRLLRDLRHDSKEFGKVDLHSISGAVFDAIEARIYADALAASSNPAVAPDTLREVKTQDVSGRWVSTFYGSPKTWMEDFAGVRQRLVGFSRDR